jgi:putative Holliday junction resolvase
VALSDPSATLATPIGVVPAHPEATLGDRIGGLLPLAQVLGLVIGLPLDQRSNEGESAQRVRRLGENVATQLGLTAHFQDERFTTAEVTRRRREAGRSGRQLQGEVDAYAAAAILQSFLDRLRA